MSTTLQRADEIVAELSGLEGAAATQRAHAEAVKAKYERLGVDLTRDPKALEEVARARTQAEAVEAGAAARRARVVALLADGGPSWRPRQSLGALAAERFLESGGYQKAKAGGLLVGKGAVHVPAVEVLTRQETLALLRTHATATWPAVADRQPQAVAGIPARPLRVLDLVQLGETGNETVEYEEETTRVDVAAETALGLAAPEASYAYASRQANVRDIAAWIPAHKRNLADESEVRALLEGRLGSSVERRLEKQVVSGDGVGENLKGILSTTGIASIAKLAGESRYDAIRRAIAEVRVLFEDEPTGVVLHPRDWQEVCDEKDANGAPLLTGAERAAGVIDRVRTVVSTVIAENTGLVGVFDQGGIVWLRSGLLLEASNAHDLMFQERRVALLAGLRAAFAAWVPRAFAKVTGI